MAEQHIIFEVYAQLFRTHMHRELSASEYREWLLGRSDREITESARAHWLW